MRRDPRLGRSVHLDTHPHSPTLSRTPPTAGRPENAFHFPFARTRAHARLEPAPTPAGAMIEMGPDAGAAKLTQSCHLPPAARAYPGHASPVPEPSAGNGAPLGAGGALRGLAVTAREARSLPGESLAQPLFERTAGLTLARVIW
jgi:hypothetical protein